MASNVLGLFQYEEDLIAAAESLKKSGFSKLSAMTPIPLHDMEHVLGLHKSPVRRFSLAGALIGMVSGFALAVACALVFLLPTGGRAIIAVPPFIVISYEVTILFGVIATLLGFFIVARLPAWNDRAYRMESNVDRFSLVVGIDPGGDAAAAEKIIRDAGAEQVSSSEEAL